MATSAVTTLQPIPYLNFNGNCEEALNFYAETLGGEIVSITRIGDTPMAGEMPPGAPNFIVNAQLRFAGGGLLYAGDTPPHMTHTGMTGCTLALNYDSVEQAEPVFKGLSEGGSVSMPFGPTFWAKGFGMCDDKFGISWMVNAEMTM